MTNTCKLCGATGHTKFRCKLKPRTPIKRTKLKTHGKHYYLWIETRDRWLEQNKAPYYNCYICGKVLTRSQLTLDHIKSRSRNPELRYKLSNLAACCGPCNIAKGSKDINQEAADMSADWGETTPYHLRGKDPNHAK